MNRMAAVFALNRKGLNIPRGLELLGVLIVLLIVLALADQEKYWLSFTFGALFVALSDPGGAYGVRFREMGWVGLVGTGLTALGFALGGGPWGWVVLAVIVVTLAGGLCLKYGVHRGSWPDTC